MHDIPDKANARIMMQLTADAHILYDGAPCMSLEKLLTG